MNRRFGVWILALSFLCGGVASCGRDGSAPNAAPPAVLTERGFPGDFPIPPDARVLSYRGSQGTGFDVRLATGMGTGELRDFYSVALADDADWALVELAGAAPLPILDTAWMTHATDDMEAAMAHVSGPYNGMINLEGSAVHIILWTTGGVTADELFAELPDASVLPRPGRRPRLVYPDSGRTAGRLVLVYEVDQGEVERLLAAYAALGWRLDLPAGATGTIPATQPIGGELGGWRTEITDEVGPEGSDARTLTMRFSQVWP